MSSENWSCVLHCVIISSFVLFHPTLTFTSSNSYYNQPLTPPTSASIHNCCVCICFFLITSLLACPHTHLSIINFGTWMFLTLKLWLHIFISHTLACNLTHFAPIWCKTSCINFSVFCPKEKKDQRILWFYLTVDRFSFFTFHCLVMWFSNSPCCM